MIRMENICTNLTKVLFYYLFKKVFALLRLFFKGSKIGLMLGWYIAHRYTFNMFGERINKTMKAGKLEVKS